MYERLLKYNLELFDSDKPPIMDLVHYNERSNVVTFGLKFRSIEPEDDEGTYSRCVGIQVSQLNNHYVGELAEITSKFSAEKVTERKFYTYETLKEELRAKREQTDLMDFAPKD